MGLDAFVRLEFETSFRFGLVLSRASAGIVLSNRLEMRWCNHYQ